MEWTQKGKFPPWSMWMYFLSCYWELYTIILGHNLDQRVPPVLTRMANFQNKNKLKKKKKPTDHRDALMRKDEAP